MGFKKDRGTNVLNEVIETLKEVIPEPEEQTTEKNEVSEEKFQEILNITKEVFPNAEVKEIFPKAEVKKAPAKKITKKKNHTKAVINCGIKGDTIEVRDFRAIVKKKGLQINVVLNGIIAEWNHTNYNL